ncbi:hypothetical protein [Deinococcus sp. JMULE3]|uniref:hypothetical protein n=1 Tax=Deinococcus sp. JMULE3 TaxID=2518341 RepID=UPI001575018A|nr:hypothetical protein [Deinococcus sp. JMULE3]NTX98907.1 hypothetical protein [Deinococcus sp. JMULE3]
MRTHRLPDEHVADLIADGTGVQMTLRWHNRTPQPGDVLHLDTLGHWRVLDVLRRERTGLGAVLRAEVLPLGHEHARPRPPRPSGEQPR